jgi:subtilisin family serine protease
VGAYTPGQLLVKFTAPPSDEAVRGAIAGMGATAIAPLGHGLWQVGVPAGQERDWMDRFQRRGDVAYAEVDRHFQNEMVGGFRMVGARTVQAAAPNDPLYPANPVNPVTHQPRLGLPGQWGLDAMQVLNAWDTTTGSGVLVAVLDTGVDLNHEDLQANLDAADAFNFVENTSTPDDDFGHGTHIAGAIAAVANNGVGIAGVAPNCKVLPIRVLGVNGGSTVALIKGIDWAIRKGAKVINMSLGSSQYSRAEEDEVNQALANDIVVVAAAGNEALNGNPLSYPAALSGVLSVAAVGRNADGSFYRGEFSNFNPLVTVAAPGVDILSTVPTRFMSPGSSHPDAPYAYASGTSMASAMACGAVALIRAAHKDWTRDQVVRALRGSAKRLGSTPIDPFFGSGLVQAAGALGFTP